MNRSRTVRRVTLVGLTACLVAALAGHRGAAAAEPPGALQHLAGCFEVSYRFVEDGVHDKDIRGDLLEEITLDAQDGVYAFQHYGIFKGQRTKHWREEWRRHPDDSFTQTVIGPSENLRYTCTARFQFNQWRCATPGAPKPLRDRERTDYQTLDRENTLQITPRGWVQAENNTKRTATGVAVSNELGWNEYRRVDEAHMAKTSFTSVGSLADSPAPLLRPSPATGDAAEILDIDDPDFGYDADPCS